LVFKQLFAFLKRALPKSIFFLFCRCQSVILEVQRLYPVVPLGVPHGTTSWTSLGDFRLPPHCMVMVLHWKLNRDPELWSRPETFWPERFLNENRDEVKIPGHFMPFQVIDKS